MNKILCKVFWVITGMLLMTGFPAHGSKCARAEGVDPAMIANGALKVFVAKNPIYVVLVEKERQRLRVLEYNGHLNQVAEYPCATGENKGKKRFSGDSRTPEGIYFITKIYTDNEITIFGKRAFHLDFPNIFDRNSGIKGDGIYIHGTNGRLTPMSTRGCITLRNRDLDKLVRFLEKDTTPVMIVPDMSDLQESRTVKFDESRDDVVKTLLARDEMGPDRIEFEYLYRLTDGIQNVAVAEFTLYQNESPSSRAYSRSYLTYNGKRGWTAEERVCRAKPLPPVPRYPKDKQKIIQFVETWREAWESKDIETYIGCYNDSFRHNRMNLAAYRAYKERLNKRYRFIQVDISGVSIRWTRSGARVSFDQVYRSDQYHAKGRKTLRLIFKGQRWRIDRESWFPARHHK
ncbi:MAG: L,D-transpeptidase family protein [Deltaproteobacteria bacterium]|nr:L,D-transpeptidase family protein [Deltaproteobacteria bacterium]MCF8120101.1 L,D-transpeptidase family protein [Deltaproteobacteria bacterium]